MLLPAPTPCHHSTPLLFYWCPARAKLDAISALIVAKPSEACLSFINGEGTSQSKHMQGSNSSPGSRVAHQHEGEVADSKGRRSFTKKIIPPYSMTRAPQVWAVRYSAPAKPRMSTSSPQAYGLAPPFRVLPPAPAPAPAAFLACRRPEFTMDECFLRSGSALLAFPAQ